MAKTDLGAKQVCPNCGAKFYDLSRRPAVCPKCTTSFDPAEEGVRVRRTRARANAAETDYEDEDEELESGAKAKKGGDDDEDEDVEATPEIDSEADAEPLLSDDDDDGDKAKGGDELPEGFSEEEEDLAGDAVDDDSVPMLEDEEEFSEDELGPIGGEDEDESR